MLQNENLINQNNEYYKQLRARAKEEGDAMARCFEESHQAYEAHEGARAKELSNEGHAHQSKMNELNAQASDWIFQVMVDQDSKPGEVDLHGLYVKEAITHTERAVHEARSRGDSEIRLIVGKGIHSQDHIAKLEPAIENLMQKYNIVAHLDEHNSGVLVVTLDGSRNDRTLELNDITRRLERKDEDCVIM
ncbi:DUF1771-domain-containing protein [Ramaria rubella]|nr:DUF1771-domain-containing protein [Ramaria rubella]